MSLAFLDTETVTLEAAPDVIWEIGIILREDGRDDQEWQIQLRPNMGRAVDEALRISRFHGRCQANARGVQALVWSPPTMVWDSPPGKLTYEAAATLLARMSYRDPWHYHLVDAENLAVGYLHGYGGGEAPAELLAPPWDSDKLTEALGLDPVPADQRHTALGDARWARSIYDLVTGGRVA